MDEQLQQRIHQINPLNTLGPQQLEELMGHADLMDLKEDDTLFRQGEKDDFAFYLVAGEILADSETGRDRRINLDADSANYALGNLQPRPFTARATEDGTRVLKVARSDLENLVARSQMVSRQMPAMTVTDFAGESGVDGAWMFQVIQSALFKDLPTENIERFFAAVEKVEGQQGQEFVRQGEPGDDFFMIAEGQCEVVRTVNDMTFPIAELGAGDSFGEEALIADKPRNATVRAKSESVVVMRLNRDSFVELLKQPTIKSIDARSAIPRIKSGEVQLLDVRMESEHGARAIKGSENIPLYRLRTDAEKLDSARPVITYCDTGARSKVAAFLLCQRGIDAVYLENGLSSLIRS